MVTNETERILRTKLNRPRLPPDLVVRDRLLKRLDEGRTLPLTLISAPAGCGKSTLVAGWLERIDWPSVWFSVDSQDSDSRRFLTHVVAGLRTVFPEACSHTMDLLRAPMDLPLRALKTTLANDLQALERPFVLVLDDFEHVEAGSPVNDILGDLLAHPPLPLHIVVISRRDPPIPLVTLRARGQLAEIRMADLRFASGETRELIEQAGGFSVSDDSLASVERELEGWAVGLRLLSLALCADPDPNAALKNLHGGWSQAREYLFQQVLAQQPAAIRDWLLKSAVLDRFCGALCDAVCSADTTGEPSSLGGASFVHAVQRSNLFVVPLDREGEWFRYHHLFRALLQRELEQSLPPERVSRLHSRARTWLEEHGLIDEALQQALRAGDAAGAADIVARHFMDELDESRWYTVDRWLGVLPPAALARPDLLVAEGWVRYEKFQLAELPAIVEQACSWRGNTHEAPVRGAIAFFRGVQAYLAGDSASAIRQLVDAQACFAGQRTFATGLVELWLGLARCAAFDCAEAVRALGEALRGTAASADRVVARIVAGLCFVHYLSGGLVPARREAERLADLARKGGAAYVEAWGLYLEGSTRIQAMDVDRAAQSLGAAVSQAHILHVRAALDALAGLALAQHLCGQSDAATESLDRLLAFAREVGESESLAVAASSRARLALLSGGEVDEARGWASAAGPAQPTSLEIFLWLEVPQLTQARVSIALGSDNDLVRATSALSAMLELCERSGYRNRIIEIRALQALALDRQNRSGEALASLQEALEIAEPGGWLLPFVESGPPMARLLERLAERKGRSDFADRVRMALRDRASQQAVGVHASPTRHPAMGTLSGESLTRRESETLAFLVKGLQNKEIAARLFVSPETVKSHLKTLYQKLGVASRREAVARASELFGASISQARSTDDADTR
jgi:LuxR family maltose regulon positive regulatory protein